MRRWQIGLAVVAGIVAILVPVVAVRLLTDEILPADAVAPVERAEILWSVAVLHGEGYELQAGGVDDEVPAHTVQVPFDVHPAAHVGITPVFSPPVDGTVYHVSDDGRESTVWGLRLREDGDLAPLAQLDDVAWSMAVAPNGSAAYLALAARGDGRDDRGVVRVALDGSGAVEMVMEPLPFRVVGSMAPAAILSSDVRLAISRDGRHLARTTCIGPDGCASMIIDVETGDVLRSEVPIIELGRDGMAIRQRCDGLDCTFEVFDLLTNEVPLRARPFDMTLRAAGLGQVAAAVVADRVGDSTVTRVDPATGAEAALYRAPEGALMWLAERGPGRWSVPENWVLVSHSTPGAPERLVLVPVDGGEPLDLGEAPWRDPFAGVQG